MTNKPIRPACDMSSAAIDQRLKDLAQLYRFGMSLAGFKILGKAREVLVNSSNQVQSASEPKPENQITTLRSNPHQRSD